MFLNNSSAETYENCWRRGYWSRECMLLGGPGGIEPPYSNENLLFGQLVHAALAWLYKGIPVLEACNRAVEEFKEEHSWDEMDYEQKNVWMANFEWTERLVEAYDAWREDHDDFQPLQIEAEGCVVLGEECYQCGNTYPDVDPPSSLTACPTCGAEVHHWVFRTDLVIADGNYVEVMDHKTTKSASDMYIASWDTSFQMWGYCYGYEKATGMEVGGYKMNILRKLKTVGLPEQTTKQCPSCRNGSKKKLSCETCNQTGRVERENNPSDQPFQRPDTYDWNDERRERFVRQRVATIRRIQQERKKFKENPDEAWPMNPKACYTYGKCPFIKFCYEGNPGEWWNPGDVLLDKFRPRSADYVSIRQLALEEAQ